MGEEFVVVAATGMLGAEFTEAAVRKGLGMGARMLGVDGGSTDPGPYHLGSGVPQFGSEALKRDTSVLLNLALEAKVPFVIGSAGTAGGDTNLEVQVDIIREIAREQGLHFRMAVIHSEQPSRVILDLLTAGRIRALAPAAELTSGTVSESEHIVGVMGAEPFQKALQGGAQVIVAGRSTDTSIFAALPLLHGCDPALVWHAAKVIECGAAAVANRTGNDAMAAVIGSDHFDIVPLRQGYVCTPQSVAAHTLYENSDPFNLLEPSGTLITRDCWYEDLGGGVVRVRGSRFEPAREYTVKLEGARLVGFGTVVMGGVRDPLILGQMDSWLSQLDARLAIRLREVVPTASWRIFTHCYGRDGVMKGSEPQKMLEGHEACLVWDVVAESQEVAHLVAATLSHSALHNPIPQWRGAISAVAFPFSAAEIDRGPVYEFTLNHVAEPDSPNSLFPIEYEDV